jgi:hypothetical protein
MIDWIQDGLLAINAVLVWRYVIATQRLVTIAQDQTDKTRVLAETALRQTQAAERNIAILESQIQARETADTNRLKANITELGEIADYWIDRMSSAGDMPRQTGLNLLPEGWSLSLDHAGKLSAELFHDLVKLQKSTNDASRSIEKFTETDQTFRPDTGPKKIAELLGSIGKACDEVSTKLSTMFPESQAH